MQRALRSIRLELEEGWSTFLLLVALFIVAAIGTTATDLAPNLWAIQPITLIALLVGLAIAKSIFNDHTGFLLSLAYGIVTLIPILGSVFYPDLGLRARTLAFLERIVAWLDAVLFGLGSNDTAMFVLFMAIVYWTMAMLAVWTIFRRHLLWEAILPVGSVLFINAYYYRGETNMSYFIVAFLVVAILLLTATNFYNRELDWQHISKSVRGELKFDAYRAAALAAAALIVVVLFAPTTAANPALSRTWREFTNDPWGYIRDNFTRSFGNLNNPVPAQSADFYGETLGLGSGQNLSETDIMRISVQDPDIALRWYWRARTFDTYQDGTWATVAPVEVQFAPDAYTIDIPDLGLVYRAGRWVPADQAPPADPGLTTLTTTPDDRRAYVFAEITVEQTAMSTLYSPGQPLWLDRPANIRGLIDTETNQILGFNVIRARDLTSQGDTYQILASISLADEQSLRNAPTTYPDWVTDYYLQVPDDVTPRTLELAAQITAGAETPYDKARAIESWLRQNINYNLSIPAPPVGLEPVDYMLFESREGFCNYYTAAMVLMLRSQGVPARMAVGFSEGRFVFNEDFPAEQIIPRTGEEYFLIQQTDAHAWPEVYFPGYGWVEFEPTASELPLNRPITPDSSPAAFTPPFPDEPDEDDSEPTGSETPPPFPTPEGNLTVSAGGFTIAIPRWLAGFISVVFAFGLIAVAIATMLWSIEWYGLRGLPAARLVYARLLRAARLIGLPIHTTDTPFERARQLHATLPGGHDAIDTITNAYVTDLFRPPTATHTPTADLFSAWHTLRRWLAQGAITHFFHRPTAINDRWEEVRGVFRPEQARQDKPH